MQAGVAVPGNDHFAVGDGGRGNSRVGLVGWVLGGAFDGFFPEEFSVAGVEAKQGTELVVVLALSEEQLVAVDNGRGVAERFEWHTPGDVFCGGPFSGVGLGGIVDDAIGGGAAPGGPVFAGGEGRTRE